MSKLDGGMYMSAKQFLEDIELIKQNALNYNPTTTDVDKRIRHRAMELYDFACRLIDNEMDSDFEDQCQGIIKAREDRKNEAEKFLSHDGGHENKENKKELVVPKTTVESCGTSDTNGTSNAVKRIRTKISTSESQSSPVVRPIRKKRKRSSRWAKGSITPLHANKAKLVRMTTTENGVSISDESKPHVLDKVSSSIEDSTPQLNETDFKEEIIAEFEDITEQRQRSLLNESVEDSKPESNVNSTDCLDGGTVETKEARRLSTELSSRCRHISNDSSSKHQHVSNELLGRDRRVSNESMSRRISNESTSRDRRISNESTSRDRRISNESTSRDRRISNESTSRDRRISNESTSRNRHSLNGSSVKGRHVSKTSSNDFLANGQVNNMTLSDRKSNSGQHDDSLMEEDFEENSLNCKMIQDLVPDADGFVKSTKSDQFVGKLENIMFLIVEATRNASVDELLSVRSQLLHVIERHEKVHNKTEMILEMEQMCTGLNAKHNNSIQS